MCIWFFCFLLMNLSKTSSSLGSRSYQCSLDGILSELQFSDFIQRMIALSGDEPLPYCTHNIVFTPCIKTPFGPARNDDVLLRLYSNVLTSKGEFIPFGDRQWTLEQHNHPEPVKSGTNLATHRVINSANINGDIFTYMKTIGYKIHFEFVKKGAWFMYGGIQVLIFRVFRVF